MDDRVRKMVGEAMRNPTAREKADTLWKEAEKAKAAKVAELAEQLLGVRPEHADPIYTQHPVMAGVIREALRRSYEAGASAIAMELIKNMRNEAS